MQTENFLEKHIGAGILLDILNVYCEVGTEFLPGEA